MTEIQPSTQRLPRFSCHCIVAGSGELRHRCDGHSLRAILTAVLLIGNKEPAAEKSIRAAESLAERILERR